jgi:methyl-accepting chemotaxis protein
MLHLSWKQKLIIIIITTLIGLMMIAGSGFIGLTSVGSSFGDFKSATKYNTNAVVLASKLLSLKLSSQELTIDNSDAFSKDLEELSLLSVTMQTDSARLSYPQLTEFSGEIAGLVADYVDGNEEITAGRKILGYKPNEGKLKAFDDALGKLESVKFSIIEDNLLIVKAGQISYILTKSEVSKKMVEKGLQGLEATVKKLDWYTSEIGIAVKAYRTVFDDVSSLIDNEYIVSVKLQNVLDNLNLMILEQKVFLDTVVLEQVSQEAESSEKTATTIMLIAAVIVGFVILISLAAIARELNVQLKYMHKFLKKMSEGDFSQQLETNDNKKDEFTQLKVAANLMVKDISYVISQVIDGNNSLKNIRGQLEDAIVLLANSSEEVEKKTQRSTVATQRISSAVGDVAKRSSHVNETAQSASDSTKAGAKIVNDCVSSMSSIVDLISKTHSEVENLSQSSVKMAGIIDVINGLADQTNLLALNAAIESARAGEAGRGFSVVADEVRALAQKTVGATSSIGDIIKSFNDQSKSMSDLMQKGIKLASSGQDNANNAKDSLSSIEDAIQQVAAEMNQMVLAVEDISTNSNDIATQVEDIFEHTESTRKTRLTLEEHSKTLCSQTQSLGEITQRFSL